MKRPTLPFLSTHSKRSATAGGYVIIIRGVISIHALQTECDGSTPGKCPGLINFYPRTPNGVRPAMSLKPKYCLYFYPRTPNGVRQNVGKRFGEMTPISIHALQTECDPKRAEPMETIIISIHALQTECDSLLHTLLFQCQYFYPRTPNGVRLGQNQI